MKKIIKVEFEDYGFEYFHEGQVTVIQKLNIFGESYYNGYEVSVRQLEQMMFGC